MENSKSDTTAEVEKVEWKQTKEHIEHQKTAMNVSDMGDKNKNVTAEITAHEAKPEREDEC